MNKRTLTHIAQSNCGLEATTTATRVFLTALLALTLSACIGGGGSNSTQRRGTNAYLNVSVSEFYFGTRDVGTNASQEIELSNRSGDIYPINQLSLNGDNADEFKIDFGGSITLQPSEKIAVSVSFSPLSQGLKNADLTVDYDIIKQVSEADNVNEQLFYDGRELEDNRDYELAMSRYNSYIRSDPVTVNKRRAAIKLPVLNESQNYGDGEDFNLYVSALNDREDGKSRQAMITLGDLLRDHPGSYLADDARYLMGYIELIDEENFDRALQHMARLRTDHPDTTYYDTALYSEALALEQISQPEQATEKYRELLQRHRSGTWAALNFNIAKDNLTSRMWFNRANQGLDGSEV